MNPQPEPARPFIPWGRLSKPIDPEETRLRYLAQSVLSGPELGVCPTLSLSEAMDVLRWAGRI